MTHKENYSKYTKIMISIKKMTPTQVRLNCIYFRLIVLRLQKSNIASTSCINLKVLIDNVLICAQTQVQ